MAAQLFAQYVILAIQQNEKTIGTDKNGRSNFKYFADEVGRRERTRDTGICTLILPYTA